MAHFNFGESQPLAFPEQRLGQENSHVSDRGNTEVICGRTLHGRRAPDKRSDTVRSCFRGAAIYSAVSA